MLERFLVITSMLTCLNTGCSVHIYGSFLGSIILHYFQKAWIYKMMCHMLSLLQLFSVSIILLLFWQFAYAGSKICYFKNGVSQGLAFEDILGGRYYPAGSLYTMPNKHNCVVRFNFGPNFNFFPQDFGGLPIPQPMSEVPRQALRWGENWCPWRYSYRVVSMLC